MYELYDISNPGAVYTSEDVVQDANGLVFDGRTWFDADWVYFPLSTNVFAARYSRDGSMKMQIMYGGKIRASRSYSITFTPIRLYEYGPHPALTYDYYIDFLLSASKGHWSWANVDPRWGNAVPYRQLT